MAGAGCGFADVARKLVLEGGWAQKKLFDNGWSDESECEACHKEDGTEKHRLYHCPEGYEVRREIPEAFTKWEQKSENLKERVEMAKRYCNASTQRKQMEQGPFQYEKKWESEKHKSWACQQKGSKATLPLTALFWVQLESGEHVAGQWRNGIMMKNWSPCTGRTARWKQGSRSSAPSRGRS